MLPVANNGGGFTPAEVAFFTSTSAVTVTGLTVEPTASYWSTFGHGVIFTLMLVGGLGFTTLATFFLILLGQRITLSERMLMRDTIGVDPTGQSDSGVTQHHSGCTGHLRHRDGAIVVASSGAG